MLNCILGSCGTGKSTMLMKEIRSRLAQNAKVLVIVPEQFSFEMEKKLYSELGAELFNRLQTYSFATLSHDILQKYRSAARNESYASEQEKLLYLYRAVQECAERKELVMLDKRRNAPDFIIALYEMITKLRKAGVTTEVLGDLTVASDRLQDKLHDLSRILLAYDKILREQAREDSLVDLTEAALLANTGYFFEGCHVFIDEFDSFTGDQYQMLQVILAQAVGVTAAIRADDPAKRPTGIFLGGNNTYLRLKRMAADLSEPVSVHYCTEYLRSPHAGLKAAAGALQKGAVPAEDEEHVTILKAADPVMEVEFICAEICRLLQENETLRCSDFAISVKNPSVYFPLLERAMGRFGLPYALSAAKPVMHMDLIRYFLTLLELLSGTGWDTELLLRYLKSPLSRCSMESVSMLEHFCFTWGIDKSDWEKPFWAENNPELEQRTKGFWGKTLEELRTDMLEEIGTLRKACQGKPVRKVCMALYEHLSAKKGLCIPKSASQEVKNDAVMLWNLLMDLLDTAVACFGDQVFELKTLHESFLLLLRSSSFSTPPQTLDSILIVDARTSRLDSPKYVFAPGVIEGEFPGEVQISGMFSLAELRELDEMDIRIARLLPELHSDELLIISKLLAAPTEHLYLTYPKTDAAHSPAEPAGIIVKLRQLFPKEIFRDGNALKPDFYVRTLEAGYFHFVRNLDQDTPELAAIRAVLEREPEYAAKLSRLVTAKTSPEHTVSPETMRLLLGPTVTLSPSGIEKFAGCAFQYFCNYVLRMYIPERNALTARTGGDFAHYCLDRLLRSMTPEQFTKLTREQLRNEVSRLSEEFSVQFFSDAVRRDGRFQFSYRKAGQSLMQLLEHIQKEMAQGHFVPVGFEVEVRTGEDGLPPLRLRDGEIICRGNIDRVDLCETDDKRLLRVVDYKTGKKTLSPEKLADGLDMQMLIYLFALQQSGAYGGAAPSGVFYMPSGQPQHDLFRKRSEKTTDPGEVLNSFYQMKGLLLDSTLPLMEPEIQRAALPVFEPENESGLYIVDDAQMTSLREHVEAKICEIADALQDGQIAPEPNVRHDSSPCKYCSYSDICGRTPAEKRKCTDEEKITALTKVFGETGKEEQE